MMGAIKTIIQAVETRMTALGFTLTKEVFDFDLVPDSIINKAYRIETRMKSNRYDSGNIANSQDEISVWIAYKGLRNNRAVRDTALDDRETVEKDLVNSATILALSSNPLLMMDGEASIIKELENYLVSKLVFTADYLKSLA